MTEASSSQLSPHDLYEVLAEVITTGGYADGTPETPEVRDPERFQALAEHLRGVLRVKGVAVSSDAIPVLTLASEDTSGKYVRLK